MNNHFIHVDGITHFETYRTKGSAGRGDYDHKPKTLSRERKGYTEAAAKDLQKYFREKDPARNAVGRRRGNIPRPTSRLRDQRNQKNPHLKLLPLTLGPFQVFRVLPNTVKIDHKGLGEIVSNERVTKAPQNRPLSSQASQREITADHLRQKPYQLHPMGRKDSPGRIHSGTYSGTPSNSDGNQV